MKNNQITMQNPRSQYQISDTEKDSQQPDFSLDEIVT